MLDFLNNLFINTPINEKGTVDDNHKFAKGLTKISLTFYSILILLGVIISIISKSVLFQVFSLLCAINIYFSFINYYSFLNENGIGDSIKIKPLYRIFIQFGILAVILLLDIEIFITALRSVINGSKYELSIPSLILIILALAIQVFMYFWNEKNVIDLSYNVYSETKRLHMVTLVCFIAISLIYVIISLLKLPIADGVISMLMVFYIIYLVYNDLSFRLIPTYTRVVHGEDGEQEERPHVQKPHRENDAQPAAVRNGGRTRQRYVPQERRSREPEPAEPEYSEDDYYDVPAEAEEVSAVNQDDHGYTGLSPKERIVAKLKDLVKEYDERFDSTNYVIEQQGINLFIMFDVYVPQDVQESNVELKLALNRHIQHTNPLYICDISVIRNRDN